MRRRPSILGFSDLRTDWPFLRARCRCIAHHAVAIVIRGVLLSRRAGGVAHAPRRAATATTGRSVEALSKDSDRMSYLTPDQAKDYGLIARVLSRVAERAAAGRPGRPRDAHKEMQKVAAVFGSVLGDVAGAFPTESHRNDCLGDTIHEALEQQRAAAETMRREQQEDRLRLRSSHAPRASRKRHSSRRQRWNCYRTFPTRLQLRFLQLS